MIPISDCVYCKATSDLNTELRLSLDGGASAVVKVCDQCADDASIKTAKQKFLERQEEIAQFLEQAKKYGLQLAPTGQSGLAIAQKQPSPPQKEVAAHQPQFHQQEQPFQQRNQPVMLQPSDDSEMVIPADRADNAAFRPVVRSEVALEGHAPLKVGIVRASEEEAAVAAKIAKARMEGQVKVRAVEAREGQVIALPVVRRDGLGTTHISISKSFTNDALQKRFKRTASASLRDPDQNGNLSDLCPQCAGEGVIGADTPRACPRCQGSGLLS